MDTGIGASRWRVRLEHLQWKNGLNVLECSIILYLIILALSASDAIITEMGKKLEIKQCSLFLLMMGTHKSWTHNTRKLKDFLWKTFLSFKSFQFYFSLIFVFPGSPDTAGRELYCFNCTEKTLVCGWWKILFCFHQMLKDQTKTSPDPRFCICQLDPSHCVT